jgi:hypothetical protein
MLVNPLACNWCREMLARTIGLGCDGLLRLLRGSIVSMYAMVRILRGMFGVPLLCIRVLHPLDFVLFEKWVI